MRETQPKENLKPPRSHTSALFEVFREMIQIGNVTKHKTPNISCTYKFRAAWGKDRTSDKRDGLDRSTHPSPSSKHHKYKIHGHETVAMKFKEEGHTTRLSLSSFRLVSFRYETIKGHTPQKRPWLSRVPAWQGSWLRWLFSVLIRKPSNQDSRSL